MKRYWKWLALLACAAVIEFLPGPTLSEEFWAGSQVFKAGAAGFAIILCLHLFFGVLKKLPVLLLAGLASQACVPSRPPVVVEPPPVEQARRPWAVITKDDDTGAQITARVAVDNAELKREHVGYQWLDLDIPREVMVTAAADGYLPASARVTVDRGTPDLVLRLRPVETTPPSPSQVRTYRGYLTGCIDSAGRTVWTPALPGAPPEIQDEWLQCLVDKGATHVPIGPFTPGPIYTAPGYPAIPWDNPDWTRNPDAIRGLVQKILAKRTHYGHGMVPVIFLFGDDRAGTFQREGYVLETVSQALDGIGQHTIAVPCGWEPAGWLPVECRDADRAWRPISRGAVPAWHGWQNRSNGASNDPFNPANTDPFLDDAVTLPDGRVARYGSGAKFWRDTSFEMFLYQTNPIRTVAEAQCQKAPYTDPSGKSGLAYYESNCLWKNRLQDSLNRVGRSVCTDDFGEGPPCGWPKRIFVIFETVTYFDYRRIMEPGTREAVVAGALEMCNHFGVVCGFGDGIPPQPQETPWTH